MEGQLGLLELSVILWLSAVEGCLLSGVPLHLKYLSHMEERGCGPEAARSPRSGTPTGGPQESVNTGR